MPKIIKPAKGTFTTADVTIDSSGRVIAAASGSGGAQAMSFDFVGAGPATGSFATSPASSTVLAYIGGGGAGSGCNSHDGNAGGDGGDGGYGYFKTAISGGTTLNYNIGAGGNTGNIGTTGNAGNAGSATTLTNVGTSNGGAGGNGGSPGGAGNAGNVGTAPGADLTIDTSLGWLIPTDTTTSNLTNAQVNAGKASAIRGAKSTTASGKPGFLAVYDA